MSWPPASDYQDAVQNPQTCFQDADLKSSEPALTRLGLPRVASGNFASVYELSNGAQRWAVRCFLRQAANQQGRYTLLSQHLAKLSLSSLVGFAYLPQGICIRGQWYPIVKMEWVEGTTLHTYVAQHLHDRIKLRSLALQWRELMEGLRRSHIAHTDLQHGNVLVTPQGQLRLVDYDGMFVPPLRGQPSQELGHPNYQHPRRCTADYDEKLDNFSALVIYTSLLALMTEPGLWDRFHTGENLIFSAADFKAPQNSDLFQLLLQSQEAAVCDLTERLARACAGTLTQTPDFKAVSGALPDIPEAKPWWMEAEQPFAKRAAPRKRASSGTRSRASASPLAAPPANPGPSWWKDPFWRKMKPLHWGWASGTAGRLTEFGARLRGGVTLSGRAPKLHPVRLKVPSFRPRLIPRFTPVTGCLAALSTACLLGVATLAGLVFAAMMLVQKVKAEFFPPAPAKTVTRPLAAPKPAVNPSTNSTKGHA